MTYPDVADENPYETPPPIPYDPEDPETYPIEAAPPPERVHMTAKEANEAAAAEAAGEV